MIQSLLLLRHFSFHAVVDKRHTCLACGKDGHRLDSCSSKAAKEIRCLRALVKGRRDARPAKGQSTSWFKWGKCPAHRCARSPHVFGPSLKRLGMAVYACNQFWKRDENDNAQVLALGGSIASGPSCLAHSSERKIFPLSNVFHRGGQ